MAFVVCLRGCCLWLICFMWLAAFYRVFALGLQLNLFVVLYFWFAADCGDCCLIVCWVSGTFRLTDWFAVDCSYSLVALLVIVCVVCWLLLSTCVGRFAGCLLLTDLCFLILIYVICRALLLVYLLVGYCLRSLVLLFTFVVLFSVCCLLWCEFPFVWLNWLFNFGVYLWWFNLSVGLLLVWLHRYLLLPFAWVLILCLLGDFRCCMVLVYFYAVWCTVVCLFLVLIGLFWFVIGYCLGWLLWLIDVL